MIKIITTIFILFSLTTNAQIVSLDVGMASNATPEFSFAPTLNAQYYLKNKDYVGLGVIYDFARQRETYITRYGTDINKRWYLNSGVGFVNDWKNTLSNGKNKKYRTYLIGVDYIFKKVNDDNPFNFYGGFDFTDEIIYLKFGLKFFHEKRN